MEQVSVGSPIGNLCVRQSEDADLCDSCKLRALLTELELMT